MIDLGNDEYAQDIKISTNNRRRYRVIIMLSLVVGIVLILAVTLTSGGDPVSEESPDDDEGYVSIGLDQMNTTLTFHISPQELGGSYVKDVLKIEQTNNPEAFQDPNSHQNKAASWLQTHPNVGETTSFKRIRQRYALLCLYFATNAVANPYTSEMLGLMVNESTPNWVNETGWLEADDECEWFGIKCSTSGFVTKINLPSNRLTGSLPHELALLKDSLEELQLFENYFHNAGDEGHTWLGQLQRLTVLSLGRSLVEYDNGIPKAIRYLTSLRDLELSEVNYTGQIQDDVFSDLVSLEYLNIDGNAFGGSVPSEISTLPNLQYLHAKGTLFEDDISFAQSMPALKALLVDDNPGLTGDVSVLQGVVTLESLSVQGTGVTGTIPSFVCEGEVFLDCSDQLCGCDCKCNY
jgi:Leucine rich repeat